MVIDVSLSLRKVVEIGVATMLVRCVTTATTSSGNVALIARHPSFGLHAEYWLMLLCILDPTALLLPSFTASCMMVAGLHGDCLIVAHTALTNHPDRSWGF